MTVVVVVRKLATYHRTARETNTVKIVNMHVDV